MKKSYILNDYDVIEILENLSLKEKLKLRKVSKQFNECVDRALKSQKELRLSIGSSNSDMIAVSQSERFHCELEINDNFQVLDDNQIKNHFEPLLNKFETLEILILSHRTTNIWYFEWLNKLFPHLKSVEIHFIFCDHWDYNKLSAFKSSLGPKCEKIVTNEILKSQVLFLLRRGLLYMPSIRSIEWSLYEDIASEEEQSLIRIFTNITENIISLTFSAYTISENSSVWETLVSGNGKHIQELRILGKVGRNGNQWLKFFCENLKQLKSLEFRCYILTSFESLENAINLENLNICLRIDSRHHRNPLIVFTTNLFVLTKLRRITIVRPGFHSDFCENMEKAFPNIEYVYLKSFEIYCRCVDISRVCLKCYKKFLTVCTKVYERKIISKKMSSIDLRYSAGNESERVLLSILETFVETKHSFNIEIDEYISSLLGRDQIRADFVLWRVFDSLREMAYRKPEIKLFFKVEILYNEKVKDFRQLLPSNLKIEIIGKENSLKSERNDENELCIHFYETSENFVVKLGSNTSITKRIMISIDSFFVKK